jgi:hypothetical protein
VAQLPTLKFGFMKVDRVDFVLQGKLSIEENYTHTIVQLKQKQKSISAECFRKLLLPYLSFIWEEALFKEHTYPY